MLAKSFSPGMAAHNGGGFRAKQIVKLKKNDNKCYFELILVNLLNKVNKCKIYSKYVNDRFCHVNNLKPDLIIYIHQLQ